MQTPCFRGKFSSIRQPLHTFHVNMMRHYYREVSDIFLTYFIS